MDGDEPDPVAVLNAWNLGWDVAKSTGAPFDHRGGALDAVYNKILWANNLPAVTPRGRANEPDWTEEELDLLRRVIEESVGLVRAALARRT